MSLFYYIKLDLYWIDQCDHGIQIQHFQLSKVQHYMLARVFLQMPQIGKLCCFELTYYDGDAL